MNTEFEGEFKTSFHVYTDPKVINLRIDKVSGYLVGKLTAKDARKLRTLLTRAIKEVEHPLPKMNTSGVLTGRIYYEEKE